MKLYSDFQKYNMFRSPSWRSERVSAILSQATPGRATRRDDEFVRQYRTYLMREMSGKYSPDELFYFNPGIFYARQLIDSYSHDPLPSMLVQARLLANTPFKVIAQKHNTTEDAIRWYEAIEFNVTDRLRSVDWVVGQIITPAYVKYLGHINSARSYYDATLKLLSYIGGPSIVDALVLRVLPGQMVNSPDDAAGWLDGQWKVATRALSLHAILQSVMTDSAADNIMRLHAKIIDIDSRSDSARSTMSSIERSILATVSQQPICHGELGKEVAEHQPLGKIQETPLELTSGDAAKVNRGETDEHIEELLAVSREEIMRNRIEQKRKSEDT